MKVRSLNKVSISKAGDPANSGGGSNSFFSKLPTAAVLACGATLPAVIGVCLGRENVGYVASFGAYLVTITHAALTHSAPELRRELLFDLVSNEGIRIFSLEEDDRIEPPPDNYLMPEIEALVKAKLGKDTRFSARVNGVAGSSGRTRSESLRRVSRMRQDIGPICAPLKR